MRIATKHIAPDDWRPIGIEDLEPAAFEVVRSLSHKSVIAGPGAGKTELLAQRACYLLQAGLCPSPRRILAISFKKDAAKNLKERVLERCHKDHAIRLDSFTFDAFSKHLLDRFYKALPPKWRIKREYDILFTNYRAFTDFLDSLPPPPNMIGTTVELHAVHRNTFEKNHVVGQPLPPNGFEISSVEAWATDDWWKGCLKHNKRGHLTFPMIGRLVELLLRTNPLILKALRATYSFVFLDEFQDTTHVQYDLVRTGFLGSNSILTAVGDNKQQIMRWAMALSDAFGVFESDFGAERVPLIRNYRSSSELVAIQHKIALAVDPASKQATAVNKTKRGGDTCAILDFNSTDIEADTIAKIIAHGVNSLNLFPRDFAILVKQKPDDYKGKIIAALQKRNIKARVEAELQDTLSERLTSIVLSFLRFGALKKGGSYWKACFEILVSLYGIDSDDSKGCIEAEKGLQKFHSKLYEAMAELPESEHQLNDIINQIILFLNPETIRLACPEYQQGDWFQKVCSSIVSYLFTSCGLSDSWQQALDDFEGSDSVPIMTIHKSKGLEYHSIIFVGLDDNAWWSFRFQPEESRSAFFVAFSRAKQRVYFTYCKARGQRRKIGSLYEILSSAGIKNRCIKGEQLA